MFRGILIVFALGLGLTATWAAQTQPATTPATSTAPAPAERALTEADNGKTIKLGNATSVAISLPGNPTTGYSWALTKMSGTALEQAGEIQYVADRARAGMVGTGGTFVARFRALKIGESTITLGYARPWEVGTAPAKTFTVTLVVETAPPSPK